jgi:CBS domain-containing protein
MTKSAGTTAANQNPTDRVGADDTMSPDQPDRQLTAQDVMSTPVVTVSVQETVWDAWSVLYRSGLRHLVVLDGNRCVGVIDDRRIALEWPLGPSRDLARRVGHMLTGRVRCVLRDTPVSELARIMLRDRIDVVPVVTPSGDVIGLVSASDLLLVLAFQDSDPS